MLEKTCITCRRYKPIYESRRNACPGAEILGRTEQLGLSPEKLAVSQCLPRGRNPGT